MARWPYRHDRNSGTSRHIVSSRARITGAAAMLVWLGAAASANAADTASPSPGTQFNYLANFAAIPDNSTAHAQRIGGGCLDADGVLGANRAEPRRFGALACSTALPSAPHELKIERGDAALHLSFIGADQHSAGDLRSTLSLEHGLPLGPLGAWQLHGDVLLEHPTLTHFSFIADEQTHLSMSRGLPWGCNLRLGASASAQGAFDPRLADVRNSEIAAELSRSFRLSPTGAPHGMTLTLAEQSAINRWSGVDQRVTLTRVGYAHSLKFGAVAADIAFTRTEPIGLAYQDAARGEIKYSRSF
jgi:hypothetical protein